MPKLKNNEPRPIFSGSYKKACISLLITNFSLFNNAGTSRFEIEKQQHSDTPSSIYVRHKIRKYTSMQHESNRTCNPVIEMTPELVFGDY